MVIKPYVIYSPNESAIQDGAGFWSNESGWVDLDDATRFTEAEKHSFSLPKALGDDARWVLFDEVHRCYGGGDFTPEQRTAFRDKVASSINSMLQDSALGETFVFKRIGVDLVPQAISPDAIDLDDLEQYEMLMFDGANLDGDSWKHIFLPKQLEDKFIGEFPLPKPKRKAVEDGVSISVSLDGGQTYQPASEGVRVIYGNLYLGDDESRGELHVNASHEGLIMVLWTQPGDEHLGTQAQMLDDLVADLTETNE